MPNHTKSSYPPAYRPAKAEAIAQARPAARTAPRPATPWRARAACRGIDTNAFFATANGQAGQQQAESAKNVCRRCPVRDECLQYALDAREAYGVWGGMTEDERRAVQNRPRRNGTPRPADRTEDAA